MFLRRRVFVDKQLCAREKNVLFNNFLFYSFFFCAAANDPQNNYIKTSKYSLLTFLPLNLFEQFQRIANFYFLCLLLLQLIPAISSLTPITTAIPLIGVLALTAVKDAYDDIVSFKSNYYGGKKKSHI